MKKFELHLANLIGKTDLIILPEMFTTGFSMDTSFAEKFDGVTINWLLHQASKINASIVGSIMVQEKDKFYNRLVVVQPNGLISKYDKKHLFSFGSENNFFTAGQKRLEILINGWKVCPLVCYDLRFPVWSRNTSGYDLLIYVASWPAARSFAWKSLLTARAIENQCYVAGVNRIGKDGNGLIYNGDSVCLDFTGDALLSFEGDESVQTVILNKKDQNDFRDRFPFLKDQDQFLLL